MRNIKYRLGNLKERDVVIDGMIVLECILRETGLNVVDCMQLAQDRDHWWAVENTIMKLQVP
jgi:hypothetical protein